MKKIFALLFVGVAALSLVACKKDPVVREFAQDGTFTAFEVADNRGVAMVTWVDVVIKDDKIESYSIDALQGSQKDGVHTWNAKAKKALGYEYGMHQDFANLLGLEDYKAMLKEEKLLEWFEQANLIEAKWLADGVDSIKATDIGDVDVLAGVTITDGGYVKLAKEAVKNAKAGKFTAFEVGLNRGVAMVTWVDVVVKDDNIESYSIDALQGSQKDGVHTWNAKAKKALGYEYGMHQDFANLLGLEDYKAMLKEEKLLEWFEQANLIEAKWLADGVDSIKATDIGDVDVLAGVTITDGGYVKLAKEAVAKIVK